MDLNGCDETSGARVEDGRPVALGFDPDGIPNKIRLSEVEDFDAGRWPISGGPNVYTIVDRGWRIRTRSGRLQIESGRGSECQRWELEPGRLPGRAIFALNPSGFVTGEAVAWCCANRVLLAMRMDEDDIFDPLRKVELIVLNENQSAQKPELRKRQYTIEPLDVAKYLVRAKVAVINKTVPALADKCAACVAAIDSAPDTAEIRFAESHLARHYWRLRRFKLEYSGEATFPTDWKTFEQRMSGLHRHRPRDATHPVNALLNYSYAVVGCQLKRAITASGLDPCYGFMHSNPNYRDNLVWDLIEPLRCEIDTDVISWAAKKTWRRSDFTVSINGICALPDELAANIVPIALRSNLALETLIARFIKCGLSV